MLQLKLMLLKNINNKKYIYKKQFKIKKRLYHIMILIFNIFCQVIDLINIISKPYYGKKFKSKYTKKEEEMEKKAGEALRQIEEKKYIAIE